jgi:hypothetical protein
MPITILVVTKFLRGKEKEEAQAPTIDLTEIKKEISDHRTRIAILEDRVKNLINGKFER